MKHGITALFCLLLISLPANAQQREYKPGINYTTLAKPKAIKPTNPLPAKGAEIKGESKKAQDPATLVWNKYKELATGQTEEQKAAEKGLRKPKAPTKPTVVKPTKTSQNPNDETKAEPQINGFAAILSEWKNTKNSKKEMRSKSFKTPQTPKTPTE